MVAGVEGFVFSSVSLSPCSLSSSSPPSPSVWLSTDTNKTSITRPLTAPPSHKWSNSTVQEK